MDEENEEKNKKITMSPSNNDKVWMVSEVSSPAALSVKCYDADVNNLF